MLEVSGSSIHVCSFLQRQPTAMPDMQRRHAVDSTTAATRSLADPHAPDLTRSSRCG